MKLVMYISSDSFHVSIRDNVAELYMKSHALFIRAVWSKTLASLKLRIRNDCPIDRNHLYASPFCNWPYPSIFTLASSPLCVARYLFSFLFFFSFHARYSSKCNSFWQSEIAQFFYFRYNLSLSWSFVWT